MRLNIENLTKKLSFSPQPTVETQSFENYRLRVLAQCG